MFALQLLMEAAMLFLGMGELMEFVVATIHIFMDSMLVVNQMKGIYKVKHRDLLLIHDAIKALTTQFQYVEFTHVPRELNKLADAVVNETLDQHAKEA